MSNNSTPPLLETLQQKTQADRERIQMLVSAEFEQLANNLKQQSNAVVSGISSDMEAIRLPFQRLRSRIWLTALAAAGLMLLFQVAIEGGIPQWLGQQIRNGLTSPQEIHQELAARGTQIVSQNNILYLILPPGHPKPSIQRPEEGGYAGHWIIGLGS